MRIALFRALGFAFPTVSLVTTSHLLRDASVGEAIDGLVTGLWFVALFLAGS
jgi:hypothetical protein